MATASNVDNHYFNSRKLNACIRFWLVLSSAVNRLWLILELSTIIGMILKDVSSLRRCLASLGSFEIKWNHVSIFSCICHRTFSKYSNVKKISSFFFCKRNWHNWTFRWRNLILNYIKCLDRSSGRGCVWQTRLHRRNKTQLTRCNNDNRPCANCVPSLFN